jgi:phosphate transport system substrate-binding protein
MFLNKFSLVAATVAVASGVALQGANAQTVVKVDGSSTVFPLTEKAAELFQKENPNIRVTVGVSGTGAGFRKFCNGETDISNASRPILKREMEACRAKGISYIELPIAYDALAVVVNAQNTWATNLTTAELKAIWEPGSKINNWSQVRQGFPNVPLRLFSPGAASGTFDYFTEAINGRAKAQRTDVTPSEDDNVLVQGVIRDRGAMAYFGLAYYEENKARLRAVQVNGVVPSSENARNGRYTPLSRPLFIYVNAEASKRPEVSRFVSFYARRGEFIASAVGYVPLPKSAYPRILSKYTSGKTGTAFGGENQVGVTIEQILAKDLQN